MSEVDELISRIKNRIEQVIQGHNQMKADNQSLRDDVQGLKEQLSERDGQIRELNEKVQVLKVASSLKGEGDDNRVVKLKINELVREIDKCIVLILEYILSWKKIIKPPDNSRHSLVRPLRGITTSAEQNK